MAHIHCDFSSECLKMNTAIHVVLPEKTDLSQVRVIYLFHGLQDNCSGWNRYTSVERYAREKNAALVIPEVQRSFYTDMALGVNYFSYVRQELPQVCQTMFGLSARRELNYVMGLSMGGYGALKCALTDPERYAACAAFSAVADLPDRVKNADTETGLEFQAIFGPDRVVPEDCDLFALLRQVDPGRAPRIKTYCGESDELFESNQRLAKALRAQGFSNTFEHWQGGHDWIFWDKAAERAIGALLD